jgi:hypothetical protein
LIQAAQRRDREGAARRIASIASFLIMAHSAATLASDCANGSSLLDSQVLYTCIAGLCLDVSPAKSVACPTGTVAELMQCAVSNYDRTFSRNAGTLEEAGVDVAPGGDTVTLRWRLKGESYLAILTKAPPSAYPVFWVTTLAPDLKVHTALYPGPGASVSPPFPTAALACTAGFAWLQDHSAHPGWSRATASFNNGICLLRIGNASVDILPIHAFPERAGVQPGPERGITDGCAP